MNRFFVPGLPATPGAEVALSGDEARHLARSKRLGPGDRVLLFDGRGREVAAVVVAASRAEVRLAVAGAPDDEDEGGRELGTRITLGVAPPKGKRMQVLLEKATELGAAALFPLVCERTVADPRTNEEHKAEKWRRTAIEAAKQSGVRRLPEILPARTFGEALAVEADLRLVLDPRGARPLRELIAAPRASVLALVGPEGGFTDAELRRAAAAGFFAARLGPTILRVETAAIAAVAAIAVAMG
jgi:16S rRNA (uracil1498-N3)-methyltransferase